MSDSLLDSASLGVGVADLLQASDKLKHVPDANLCAQGLQVYDPFLFGLIVAATLLRAQLNRNLGFLF